MTASVDQVEARRASIIAAAQLACLLEATAPKPGNVSPGRPFPDMSYHDFLASAAAIGPALASADRHSLGVVIRRSVEATARWVSANSNLGIVLLLAPMVKAAIALPAPTPSPDPSAPASLVDGRALWTAVEQVLAASTVDDAQQVYAAIRLAAPGGLGRAAAQDVAGDPSVTLLEAMRLAADRDGVAREYATGYRVTREVGVPALVSARRAGLSWDDALVETFLVVLSRYPDTHIARKAGGGAAAAVSRRAAEILAAGGVRTPEARRALDALDRTLRTADESSNPGTTADLTAASAFALLLTDGWRGAGTHE